MKLVTSITFVISVSNQHLVLLHGLFNYSKLSSAAVEQQKHLTFKHMLYIVQRADKDGSEAGASWTTL